MCDSEHGAPCLTHLSWEISEEFGRAYKSLISSKEQVSRMGRLTEEYREARDKCLATLSETDISEDFKRAVAKCLQTSESVLELSARKKNTKARGKTITPSLAERARQASRENAEAKKKLGEEIKREGNIRSVNDSDRTHSANHP